jgi:hypothetical protein
MSKDDCCNIWMLDPLIHEADAGIVDGDDCVVTLRRHVQDESV